MPDTMTQPAALMMGLLVFLIIAAASVLLAFRVYAGRALRADQGPPAGAEARVSAPFRLGAGGRVEAVPDTAPGRTAQAP